MAKGAGTKITCTECGGQGFVVQHPWSGPTYPQECKGCGGTGVQMIRPAYGSRAETSTDG